MDAYRVIYEEGGELLAAVVHADDAESAIAKLAEVKGGADFTPKGVFLDDETERREDKVSECLRLLRWRGSHDPRYNRISELAHDWLVKLRRAVVLAHLQGYEVTRESCGFDIHDICEKPEYYRRYLKCAEER